MDTKYNIVLYKKNMKKKLTCHCGGVEIEANIPEPLEKIVRCNCSICKRKGAIMTLVNSVLYQLVMVHYFEYS